MVNPNKNNNPERETRILDAARDLFIRYGYDKTPVSDIAREAGISKGAIYLHFDSKDALFEALLIREMIFYSETWLKLIDADPQGGTIASLYKNTLYALNSSTFMTAIFKQDPLVFGNYLRKPNNFFRKFQAQSDKSPREVFVEMMQEAGAVRQDIDATIIAHIMDMLAYGLVSMDAIKSPEKIPPINETIEGIAAIMDKALTPDEGGNPEAGRVIFQKIVDLAREQYTAMQDSK